MGSDPQHVAYPGAEGSYTEEAAGRLYPSARQTSFPTFDLVAAALVAGDVDRGVLPIENSLAGLVPETLAILEEGAVSIVAEVALHIPHCLVGPAGATLETVRVVHSHPMALAQCRAALNGRYERVAASTTSEAARTVAALGDITVAAIASPLAARRNGLTILAEEISDHPENLTRFVSLARHTRLDRDAHTEWHTALRLITRHEPGALHDAIEPLRYHGVQMTSLHSRPIMGEPWRYQFYIDVEGHRSERRVLRALRDVAERSAEMYVLGSYPVSRGVR
jgi:prephenate dehydratase